MTMICLALLAAMSIVTIGVPSDKYPLCLLERLDVTGESDGADSVIEHVGKMAPTTAITDAGGEDVQGSSARITSPGLLPFRHAARHFFSCVDPRAEYAVLGAPGGDIGELALAFSAAEKVMNVELAPYQVQKMFDDFVEEMARNGREHVYMHTDSTAVAAWAAELGADPLHLDFERDQPRAVLSSVSNPEHIGCSHLRAMVENESDYGIRAEITKALIQAFYTIYLDHKHPLRFDSSVPQSNHVDRKHLLLVVYKIERATASSLISITAPKECLDVAPLIIPTKDDSSISVYHRYHVNYFRMTIAKFINSRSRNINVEAMYAKMNELSEDHVEKVAGIYSEGKQFQVEFSSGIEDSPF